MYAAAATLREMHLHTRLNVEFRSDLCWWHTFLMDWNGLSLLHWDDMIAIGPPTTRFKQMLQEHGAVVPFGMANGFNGVGHQTGPSVTSW